MEIQRAIQKVEHRIKNAVIVEKHAMNTKGRTEKELGSVNTGFVEAREEQRKKLSSLADKHDNFSKRIDAAENQRKG